MDPSMRAIFLSFLAYQSESDIAFLNANHSLWPSALDVWIPVWEELKPYFINQDASKHEDEATRGKPFQVFSCSDYNIGDTQFVYAIVRREKESETEYEYEDELIIAFRGTKTVRDVLTDVRVDKDKCTDICYTPRYLHEAHGSKRSHSQPPLVHSGFHEMYGIMKYALFDVVQRHIQTSSSLKLRQITLTGHSLGGAVSILATSCLLYGLNQHLTQRVYNITFGTPKVGNWDFSLLYNSLVEKGAIQGATHYFHNSDPVPCLPLLSGFYCCNNAVQINSTNESRFYSVQFHCIECYLKHLKHIKS
jgi:Lipase (class 3)